MNNNNANNDQAQAQEVIEVEPEPEVPEPDVEIDQDQENQEPRNGELVPAPRRLLRVPQEHRELGGHGLGLGRGQMEEHRHPGGGGDAARYPLFPIFRHLPQRLREQRERDREDRRRAREAAQELGRNLAFEDPEAVRQRQGGGGDLNIRRHLLPEARAAQAHQLPNELVVDPRIEHGDRGAVAAARELPPAGFGIPPVRGRGAAATDQAGPSTERRSAEDTNGRGRGEVGRGRGRNRRGRGRGRGNRFFH